VLGPAWHRGDDVRRSSRLLLLLTPRLLPGFGGCLAGCGEQAARGVDGGGE
jgi:hypothetical protein